MIYAHRWSYAQANGPIADGVWILHRCDNPLCVNPEHLFAGDHAANMRDMAAKGRGRGKNAGEKHRSAKLTEAAVHDIRRRYAAGGISQQQLAHEYSVSQPAVRDVIQRRTWRHI